MYHRVLTKSESLSSFSNTGIVINNDTFESQIKYLKKRFNIVSIEQLAHHIKENIPFEGPTCLITFDDGWIDNFSNASVILYKYNVPAIVFLPIDYIGTGKLFWQESLSLYLHQIIKTPGNHQQFLQKNGLLHPYSAIKNNPTAVISEYISSIKKLPNEEIDKLLHSYHEYANNLPDKQEISTVDNYMDWEQVKKIREKGISLGSHAISHRLLTSLSEDKITYEVTESRNILQSQLGETIDAIAYPNGNYDGTVLKSVKKAGYTTGFSTVQGYFCVGDDPYQIKRINIHQNATNNIPMFLCRILGIF